MSYHVLVMLSSKNFIVSCFTFKSLVYFEFIFCMVLGSVLISFFCVSCLFSQHHLLKRLSFLHCIFLSPLSKTRCPEVCRFISGLSVLFHWSIFLFLCQDHIVWITVALQYSLKSGRLIPPFFFLKIALAIQSFVFSYKL